MSPRLTTDVTTQRVYVVVGMGRRYVVKRLVKRLCSGEVKEYYYVYEQYREGNKVITKYIGPFNEIVETYKKLKQEVVRGVGFEPTQAYAIGSSARPL